MYFAHPYQFGTRFERKGLLSLDGFVMVGNTSDARNATSSKTNILNMYGQHQMHQIGKNINESDITATSVDALNNLWRATKTDDDYAVLEFSGSSEYSGGSVLLEFNLTNEFFFGAELPFYKLEINTPTYTDKTPTDAKNAAWTNFLKNFDTILSDLSMDRAATKETGIGDVSAFVGWTRSVDELDNLDFLDATVRVGATLGTADAKNEDKAFSIAPGYDKHKGFFVSFDTAFGTHEHLSFGFHAKQLFLFKSTKTMRMQSAAGQNGFINSTFRCTRLDKDYPGFFGQNLIPGDPIEINPLPLICETSTDILNTFTSERELIKYFDIFGRESISFSNNILFYVYSDGFVEKKLMIE